MCVTLHDCIREVNPLLIKPQFIYGTFERMFIGEGGRIGRRDLLIMILISKRGNLKSNINVQDNLSKSIR